MNSNELKRRNANTQLILSYLSNISSYIAADDLYIRMRTEGVNIGMATVYKHLKMLRELGLIHVDHSSKRARYSYS